MMDSFPPVHLPTRHFYVLLKKCTLCSKFAFPGFMWAGGKEKGPAYVGRKQGRENQCAMTNVHKVEFQMERVEKYRNSLYFLSIKERDKYLLRWGGVI